MIRSIELECVQGNSHPADLIAEIVDGTALENLTTPDNTSICFNDTHHQRWKYPQINEKVYEQACPILKERIMALYEDGIITYGSW